MTSSMTATVNDTDACRLRKRRPFGARRPQRTAACSPSGTASPNHTQAGQKWPPPVIAQPRPTASPMATERNASNRKMACQRPARYEPLAALVPTLTHPTISDPRGAGDFLSAVRHQKGG